MFYGISLKKIMRVIIRVYISDNLIIIFFGIFFYLRWIYWIVLDKVFLFSLFINYVILEKFF